MFSVSLFQIVLVHPCLIYPPFLNPGGCGSTWHQILLRLGRLFGTGDPVAQRPFFSAWKLILYTENVGGLGVIMLNFCPVDGGDVEAVSC